MAGSRTVPSRAGRRLAAMALACCLAASPTLAQQVIAYPEKGQSPQQQERDRYECYNWATQQTGFNPQTQLTQPAPSTGGEVVGGAARGAAIGAVGGAIGGDAGKGAGIGAAAGGMFGAMRRNENRRQVQQQQQQNAMQMDSFNRAMGACLRGRGYTLG